jgi:hypothetical protein
MYEHHKAPLPPRRVYVRRVGLHAAVGVLVLAACVGIGMIGYHVFEQQNWVDAFANACMILSGMGPLDPIKTIGGRVFAAVYALFSGVAFLTTVGFFLMPTIHRLLHKFHHAPRPRETDGEKA